MTVLHKEMFLPGCPKEKVLIGSVYNITKTQQGIFLMAQFRFLGAFRDFSKFRTGFRVFFDVMLYLAQPKAVWNMGGFSSAKYTGL